MTADPWLLLHSVPVLKLGLCCEFGIDVCTIPEVLEREMSERLPRRSLIFTLNLIQKGVIQKGVHHIVGGDAAGFGQRFALPAVG